MSTPTTLDAILTQKADAEFNRLISDAIKSISYPQELFGTYCARNWKTPNGEGKSFYQLGQLVAERLEVYREDFREKKRHEFVAKVEAMQKEMESYIGAIQVQQQEAQQ